METKTPDHVMNRKSYSMLKGNIIQNLAKSTVLQMDNKGYKGISYQKIYDSLLKTPTQPDSLRMQFNLPRKGFEQIILDSYGEEILFLPRRIVTTFQTEYIPTPLERGFKEWRSALFEERVRGYDAGHVCRNMRKDESVQEIFENALERGIRYAMMGTIVSTNEDSEGRVLHDDKGRIIKYTSLPWIVLPKANEEEIKQLDEFCERYQIPSKETIQRLSGEI